MFTDRPYDGFSVVSTGLKCTLQACVHLRRVFSLAVSQMDYIWGLLSARAPYSPFPSLPGYLRLRFRCFQSVKFHTEAQNMNYILVATFIKF